VIINLLGEGKEYVSGCLLLSAKIANTCLNVTVCVLVIAGGGISNGEEKRFESLLLCFW